MIAPGAVRRKAGNGSNGSMSSSSAAPLARPVSAWARSKRIATGRRSRAFAFGAQIGEHCAVAFDLKEIIASRLGENYELHERHINRTLVSAQRVIGFDKVYARAQGAYIFA